MNTKTGIALSLCGSLLSGCAIVPGLSSVFDATPKLQLRLATTAQSEYERGKQLHRTGQYVEAKQAYISALSLDPMHAEAKNGIAALMGTSGDLDNAIVLLEQLSKDHPAPHVYSNLAYALQLRGRALEARDALQQALAIDPSHEGYRRRFQALDQQLTASSHIAPVTNVDILSVTASADNLIEATGPTSYVLRYPVSASAPLPSSLQSAKLSESKSNVSVGPLLNAQSNVPSMLVDSPALSVELVNGNGINGLAKQMGDSLPVDRWRVVRTANYKHYSVEYTWIEYLPHHADDARRFSSLLGIGTRSRPNTEQKGTLRVILGRDYKNISKLKERLVSVVPTPSS